jgi:hypothetical protein
MSAAMPFQQNRVEMRRRVALVPGWAMVWMLEKNNPAEPLRNNRPDEASGNIAEDVA